MIHILEKDHVSNHQPIFIVGAIQRGYGVPPFDLFTRLSAVTSTSSLSCPYLLRLLFSCDLFFSLLPIPPLT